MSLSEDITEQGKKSNLAAKTVVDAMIGPAMNEDLARELIGNLLLEVRLLDDLLNEKWRR